MVSRTWSPTRHVGSAPTSSAGQSPPATTANALPPRKIRPVTSRRADRPRSPARRRGGPARRPRSDRTTRAPGTSPIAHDTAPSDDPSRSRRCAGRPARRPRPRRGGRGPRRGHPPGRSVRRAARPRGRPRAPASVGSWVTATTVTSSSVEDGPQLEQQPLAQQLVERGERLVEQERRRAEGRAPGPARPAAPRRPTAWRDRGPRSRGGRRASSASATRRRRSRALDAGHPQAEADVAGHVQVREQRLVLEHDADAAPVRAARR